jgi:hypothetical protein
MTSVVALGAVTGGINLAAGTVEVGHGGGGGGLCLGSKWRSFAGRSNVVGIVFLYLTAGVGNEHGGRNGR